MLGITLTHGSLSTERTEVPANIQATILVGQFFFHERIHFTCIGAVYISLFEENKLTGHVCIVLLDKLHNFFVGPWLLSTKLVARKSQDLQAPRTVLVIKLGELSVAYFRCASFGSNVYGQQDI